jgi:lysophospholipase L1-like esterase
MLKIFLKKSYYFIILLIIIIFSIFFLEFLLRIYGLGDPIIYKTNLSYRYAPSPNQSVIRLNKSKITINDKSLRATQQWDSKNLNKILFLGDSVTYGGSYIDDKEIFSELVCQNLNQVDKKKYLCGNAGVNAYGVDNIKNRILYGEVQDSNWIIVTLIGEDGFRSLQDVTAIPAFLNKPKFFPAIQEICLHLAWKLNIFLRTSYSYNLPAQTKTKINFVDFFEESFRSLNNTLITELAKGKKILVVFHPSKESVLSGIETEEYVLMKNIFKEKQSKLLFLDMFFIIKSSYSSDLYYDSAHLDQKGHKLFAERISTIISEHDNKY